MGHWSYQEMRECFGYSLDQYIFMVVILERLFW